MPEGTSKADHRARTNLLPGEDPLTPYREDVEDWCNVYAELTEFLQALLIGPLQSVAKVRPQLRHDAVLLEGKANQFRARLRFLALARRSNGFAIPATRGQPCRRDAHHKEVWARRRGAEWRPSLGAGSGYREVRRPGSGRVSLAIGSPAPAGDPATALGPCGAAFWQIDGDAACGHARRRTCSPPSSSSTATTSRKPRMAWVGDERPAAALRVMKSRAGASRRQQRRAPYVHPLSRQRRRRPARLRRGEVGTRGIHHPLPTDERHAGEDRTNRSHHTSCQERDRQ